MEFGVDGLFQMENSRSALSTEQIQRILRPFRIELSLVRALIDVESGGSGFNSDGSVKILFERHIFWSRLQIPGREINPKRIATEHPELCGQYWDPKRYPYGPVLSQWPKVYSIVAWAQKNDPQHWESYKRAAYESCSYGLFQILGYHYEKAGFPTVYDFKHGMEESEARQLEISLGWMNKSGVLQPLRERNWTRFVRLYNGPANIAVYSAKLQEAYDYWSGQPVT